MSKVYISFACWDYDRTRPLMDGKVKPEGIELNYLPFHPAETFFRMARYQEFEASEMSLSTYLILRSRASCPFVAIPIFPSRCFRHSGIYVNKDSGIEKPEDLKGKKVGVPEYQVTAALWIRGLLQHEYGIAPRDLLWFTGGQEQPGREEKIPIKLPQEVKIEPIAKDKTLAQMLESGELDALITPMTPSVFSDKSLRVKRLFSNYRETEEEYYKRTGIFPIIHTVVIRKDIYNKHPWVATNLCKALEEAKRICYRDLTETGALKYTLPWVVSEVEREKEIFGEDLWPYGVEPSRRTLEALTLYSFEQHLSERKLEVEELFAPNTLEMTKI